MRSASNLRKKEGSLPWKWIVIVVGIFVVLFFLRGIDTTTENTENGTIISWSGSFVVTKNDGSKKDIKVSEKFYMSDLLFSVISWTAEFESEWGKIWLDKTSEISHNETHSGWYILSQWRMWIEAKNTIHIWLKHIEVELSEGDIALIEQQRIYSIVYILRWNGTIRWNGRETQLNSGKRIMVSQSNLINPWVTLESLMGDIDDSIQQNAFFLARNGKALLESIEDAPTQQNGSWTVNSIVWSGASIVTNGKLIVISSPLDGSVITGGVLSVEGRTLSAQVKKIVINDQSLLISDSPWSFRTAPITITSSTVDIVYRAYDANNNLLERWVLTLYSSAKWTGSDKLVPKTFPVSDKDFKITNPSENPYKTSLTAVTVSGSVPKWAVEYITVNNFRLKKFVAGSTNWYYYANVAYQTMKDGFNLYEIRFYWPNDTLLSTQLFTIIKEWDKTVSWE